jgi:hypothetical protein
MRAQTEKERFEEDKERTMLYLIRLVEQGSGRAPRGRVVPVRRSGRAHVAPGPLSYPQVQGLA